jgi:hypothetical protein
MERFTWLLGVGSWAAHLGVVRLSGALGELTAELPEPVRAAAAYHAASPQHLASARAELLAWEETRAAVRGHSTLGERPLVVLSATTMPEGQAISLEQFQALHAELAQLSPRSEHRRVPGADHLSLLCREAHAHVTASAILDVVRAARAPRP